MRDSSGVNWNTNDISILKDIIKNKRYSILNNIDIDIESLQVTNEIHSNGCGIMVRYNVYQLNNGIYNEKLFPNQAHHITESEIHIAFRDRKINKILSAV